MALIINHKLCLHKYKELLKYLIGEILLLLNSIKLKIQDLVLKDNLVEFNLVHKINSKLKMPLKVYKHNFLTKFGVYIIEIRLEIFQHLVLIEMIWIKLLNLL